MTPLSDIKKAMEAGPVGHLHSNGDYCADRPMHSALWPIDLYAIDRRDVAALLQHIEALEAERGKLRQVLYAAKTYAFRYAQDEAEEDGPEDTGCSEQQAQDARRLFAALELALPPAAIDAARSET